jgi:hypothetical protein
VKEEFLFEYISKLSYSECNDEGAGGQRMHQFNRCEISFEDWYISGICTSSKGFSQSHSYTYQLSRTVIRESILPSDSLNRLMVTCSAAKICRSLVDANL